MSRLVKTLKYAFQKMVARKWDTVYIFVDMHETVLKPTWDTTPSHEFYPKALKTLQLMSGHQNIKLILWSSSLPEINLEYQKMFREKGVNFVAINENPYEGDTSYADFTTKPYMSLILDDKAGFQQSDWEDLHDYMVMLRAIQLLVEHEETSKAKAFLDDLEIDLKYGF